MREREKQTLPAAYSAEDGAASRKVYACERRHIGQVARVCVRLRGKSSGTTLCKCLLLNRSVNTTRPISLMLPPCIFLYPCKMCHVFSSEIINNCVFLMANRMLNYFFLIPWQCSRLQAKTSLMKWIWCKENFGGWADFTILLHVKQPWESKVKWGEEKWSEYRCTVCLLRFRDEGAGRLTLTTELRRRAAQVWGCFTNIRVRCKAS